MGSRPLPGLPTGTRRRFAGDHTLRYSSPLQILSPPCFSLFSYKCLVAQKMGLPIFGMFEYPTHFSALLSLDLSYPDTPP